MSKNHLGGSIKAFEKTVSETLKQNISFLSVLSLRVFPSRWSIVNLDWVQHVSAVAPWRKLEV